MKKKGKLNVEMISGRACMKKLNTNGQALVEYLLIIAVISVIVVSVVKLLGGYIQDSMTKSSCALVDKTYVEGSKPGEGRCE